MQPPYRSEEIATALLDAAQRAGLRILRLNVLPDTKENVWLVRVEGPAGEVQRLTFPFASARGIYTPGEIANSFVRGGWPFGS